VNWIPAGLEYCFKNTVLNIGAPEKLGFFCLAEKI
jgi:hypothetical protein